MTVLRTHRLPRPVAEVGLFALALIVYQASRVIVMGDASTAFANAARVVDVERAMGVCQEGALQGALLGQEGLMRALDQLYLWGHWTITPAFFVWLYRWRPRAYPMVRNGFFLANGLALAVFVAFPVAPPRLVPGLGLVDTLHAVSDVDLHGGALSGWFNPYAAVPSMHFGYAALIGVTVALLVRSWPVRIVALAYPALIFVVITATANHYVLDSLAGAGTMAIGLGAIGALAHHRRRAPRPVAPGWGAPGRA